MHNIKLESLQESHRNDLYVAAQDDSIWTYFPGKPLGDQFHIWFNKTIKRSQEGIESAFVVRRISDNKILGSTRYYSINQEHKRLAIGYTWYIPEVWGTTVNVECKYLLLQYAFETLGFNRVEFSVDARNVRSRAALKKIGAMEEGALRQHMILEDGYVRDTVVYSILSAEWNKIRKVLDGIIAQ